MFLPGTTEWQAWHFLKTCLPASGSPIPTPLNSILPPGVPCPSDGGPADGDKPAVAAAAGGADADGAGGVAAPAAASVAAADGAGGDAGRAGVGGDGVAGAAAWLGATAGRLSAMT